MKRYRQLLSGSLRLIFEVILAPVLSASFGLCVAVAAPLQTGDQFRIPTMEPVGNIGFDRDKFKDRWLLLFASSRDSADESKRWGNVIRDRYETKIAGWNRDRGQRVLVVPVLDTSSGLLDNLPLWATKFLVKNLGGGEDGQNERVGVLLDRTGQVRNQLEPPSPSDAVLVLVGPDSKLEAYAIGDYSPESAAKLFAAMDSALDGAK